MVGNSTPTVRDRYVALDECRGIVLIFSVAVLIFAMERGAVSRILRGKVFVALGESSYSIYLSHTLLLVGAFSVAAVLGFVGQNAMGETAILAHGILGDALTVVFLLCVMGISRLTYLYIERPGSNLVVAGRSPDHGRRGCVRSFK